MISLESLYTCPEELDDLAHKEQFQNYLLVKCMNIYDYYLPDIIIVYHEYDRNKQYLGRKIQPEDSFITYLFVTDSSITVSVEKNSTPQEYDFISDNVSMKPF